MDNPIQRLVDAMSDDLPRRCREAAETSFSGRGVLYAAADRIEALVKQRDEALSWGEREHQMAEEYERGREAGIREAAEVVTEHYQTMCTEHRLLLVNRASAILALIDKPTDSAIPAALPDARKPPA